MRKLWVKARLTLDGVFDAATMDHWWQNTNSPERMRYITEEYSKSDAYLLGRVTEWHSVGDSLQDVTTAFHKQ